MMHLNLLLKFLRLESNQQGEENTHSYDFVTSSVLK